MLWELSLFLEEFERKSVVVFIFTVYSRFLLSIESGFNLRSDVKHLRKIQVWIWWTMMTREKVTGMSFIDFHACNVPLILYSRIIYNIYLQCPNKLPHLNISEIENMYRVSIELHV